MRALTYIAALEKGRDGYSVYFHDLPGCISWGKNKDIAMANAKEALELHIYGMEYDGEKLPKSRFNVLDEDNVSATIFPDEVREEMDCVPQAVSQ